MSHTRNHLRAERSIDALQERFSSPTPPRKGRPKARNNKHRKSALMRVRRRSISVLLTEFREAYSLEDKIRPLNKIVSWYYPLLIGDRIGLDTTLRATTTTGVEDVPTLGELMSRTREILEGMHRRYSPDTIPFVFVGLFPRNSSPTGGQTIRRERQLTQAHSSDAGMYLYRVFSTSYARTKDPVSRANVARLMPDGKISFDITENGHRILGAGKDTLSGLDFTPAVSNVFFLGSAGKVERVDGRVTASFTLRRGGLASPGFSGSLLSGDCSGDVDEVGAYLMPIGVKVIGAPQVTRLLPRLLSIACSPINSEIPSGYTVGISGHNSRGSLAASERLPGTIETGDPTLPVAEISAYRTLTQFTSAYLDYLNCALATIPFSKVIDFSVIRNVSSEAGATEKKITLSLLIDITVEGGIGVSPTVIPSGECGYISSLLQALASAEKEGVGRHPTKAEDPLPLRRLRTFLHKEIESRGITPLRRNLRFEIPLYETSTNFRDDDKYNIDIMEVLGGLREQGGLEGMTMRIRHAAEPILDDMVAEYMDTVGDKILSLYSDEGMQSTLRHNFMRAVDAYKNRFFTHRSYSHPREFSEKIDKHLEVCYSRMESILEQIHLDKEHRDIHMNVISLLPDASSPRFLQDTFSRRKNSLVFKTEDGQLAYYELKLELGSGDTACHRLVKFPKVFADGIVIAPDKSLYQVTANDLVRGRILRSKEVTLEQVIGEFNHGTSTTTNSSGERNASSNNSGVEDEGGDRPIRPASPYEEFGFSEDIGDEERQQIDLALQNQILPL